MRRRPDPFRLQEAFGEVSPRQRLAADRFFDDLMGRPARRFGSRTESSSAPAYTAQDTWAEEVWPEAYDEAVPRGGTGLFRHAALGGSGNNVAARWNVDSTTGAGTTIDVVVHLHGYGRPGAGFIERKAVTAGVDMVDSSGRVTVRSTRPTLALVPRGTNPSGSRWTFPRLATPAAFNDLVVTGINWLATDVLGLHPVGPHLMMGRITLMAHSGGGAGLSTLLSAGLDPNEVVCYDSTYGRERPIIDWATRHIGASTASDRALRVFYLPCGPHSWSQRRDGSWKISETEVRARRIKHALDGALSGKPASVVSRYQVHRTTVTHNSIPSAYTPLLLNDITATNTTMHAPPSSSTRPRCAANSSWLTSAPVRPTS